MHVTPRLATRVAVLALSLGAVAVPLANQAHAATPPALTASPAAHLHDGDVVSVTGTNFPTTAPAGATAYIVECSSLAGSADCDTHTLKTATVDNSGNIPATDFTVKAGAIGTGGKFCPAVTATDHCYLVATTNPGDPTDTSSIGYTEIDFAPVVAVTPSSNVKSGDTLTVAGYGFPKVAQTVYVTECSTASATGCDGATNVQPVSTANGTFTTPITVHSGAVGDGTCNGGETCLITATTDITGTVPDSSGAATFTFAAKQQTQKFKTTLFAAAKAKHGKVKVSGTISANNQGVKGLTVKVYERAKGTKKWKKAGKATAGKGGSFVVKGIKQAKHAEQYQAKHAKQTLKGVVYLKSHSGVSTIK